PGDVGFCTGLICSVFVDALCSSDSKTRTWLGHRLCSGGYQWPSLLLVLRQSAGLSEGSRFPGQPQLRDCVVGNRAPGLGARATGFKLADCAGDDIPSGVLGSDPFESLGACILVCGNRCVVLGCRQE